MDPAGNFYVLKGTTIKKIPAGGSTPVTVASGIDPLCNFAVDVAGNIYETATDNGLACIKKHPANGDPTEFVVQGRSGSFGPITIDGAGNLYTSNGGVISIIPLGGGAERDFDTGFDHIPGMAVDVVGDLFFSGATAPGFAADSHAYEMKPAGGYFVTPVLPAGLYLNSITGAISGTPIAQSPSTTYVVTGYNASGLKSTGLSINVNLAANPIISYPAPPVYLKGTAITNLQPYNTGSPVAAPGYNSTTSTIGSGFVSPVGVAADAAGNIYIGDSNLHSIQKASSGGALVTIATGISNPISLAADAAGNLYVADPATSSVKKIPADGSSTVTVGTGFSAPNGVTVDAAGNVYVADSGNGLV
jgi:hypothetical protein